MTWNMADLFERVADAVPDRECLVAGDRRLTYRQLDERATRLAHWLADQGVNIQSARVRGRDVGAEGLRHPPDRSGAWRRVEQARIGNPRTDAVHAGGSGRLASSASIAPVYCCSTRAWDCDRDNP